MDFSPFPLARKCFRHLRQTLIQFLRKCAMPDHHALLPSVAADLTRNRTELVKENAFLRQQMIILSRQVKRPTLTWRDRITLVLLGSRLRTWKKSLLIIQPDTLLRWHREMFRRV